MSSCEHCGGPLPPYSGRGRPRKFCSSRCARTVKNARTRAHYAANKDAYAAASRKWVENNRARVRRRRKAWKAKNPDKVDRQIFRARLQKYGISEADYTTLRKLSGGLCQICGVELTLGRKSKTAECIDHCHETGRIRGLLCNNCNTGIGRLGDTVGGLERALRYLKGEKP